MIGKLARIIGIGLAGLGGIVGALAAGVYVLSEARLNTTYHVEPQAVDIPTDEAAIERGEHIAVARFCVGCHGADLAGEAVVDDPLVGLIVASNLTSGEGGVGRSYGDADWVRAIRHGVGPDGMPLVLMPAWEFYYLSDEDLGALIAYLKTVPPVNRSQPPIRLTVVTRTLFLSDNLFAPLLSAETLDHTGPRPEAPAPGVTTDYGKYLALGCTGCHGENLSGGPIPGAPASWPPPLNLTPGGELTGWSADDFIRAMRTGVTPGGRQLDAEYMPWPTIGQMTDDELRAIFLYLQSAPPLDYGNR